MKVCVVCCSVVYQAEEGIRDEAVAGVRACDLPVAEGETGGRVGLHQDACPYVSQIEVLGGNMGEGRTPPECMPLSITNKGTRGEHGGG